MDFDPWLTAPMHAPVETVVRVEDEGGNALGGATVYREGALAGTTDPDGTLIIAGLQQGEQLAATYRILEEPTLKANHSQDSTQNWGYRVYLTSVDIDASGAAHLYAVTSPDDEQILTVKSTNTQIGFNVVASVEWDATAQYLEDLRQGFSDASAYLYDATDGQMLFERVTVYDNSQHWGDADYRFRADNSVQPFVMGEVGQILASNWSRVYFGRGWPFFPEFCSRESYTGSDGFRTFVHEFGHYGLGLYDSYQRLVLLGLLPVADAHCTSSAIRRGTSDASTNATLMDYQYNCTEFSMRNAPGLWDPQCEDTRQWQENHESDWETIVRRCSDPSVPERWELATPDTLHGVVEGPSTVAVAAWYAATIGLDADTGICGADLPFLARDSSGSIVARANVWLRRETGSTIYQGYTDDCGKIDILGAGNGDQVLVELRDPLWRTGHSAVQCTAGLGAVAAAAAEVTLEPAPFSLDISATPAGGPNGAEVRVKASTVLTGTPQVDVHQSGATAPIAVAMGYDPGADIYTGTLTLDVTLPQEGSVEVNASDTEQHFLRAFSAFTLAGVAVSNDVTVYSGNGAVELYLPAGTVSANGRLSIVPETGAGATPDELAALSGPYTVQGEGGVTLTGDGILTMHYLDVACISNLQIYRWDTSSGQWVALTSALSGTNRSASAWIDTLGTYALMGEPECTVFLPLTVKNY